MIERASAQNWSVYVPDLPGCVSTGPTVEDARRNIAEAIVGHLEITAEHGEPLPEPTTVVDMVEVDVAVPVVAA